MTFPQITYAEACQDLSRDIKARFGDGSEILDNLIISIAPARHYHPECKGFAILAHRPGEPKNVAAAYYGDIPPQPDADR
jgi:hypothetical protein